MERECFESEDIAKAMNENFVNIKVDREERPDVDKMYMTFVQVIKWLKFPKLFVLLSLLESIQQFCDAKNHAVKCGHNYSFDYIFPIINLSF